MPDERSTTEAPLKESVIHSPAHLEKIRDMYVHGLPISLPEALEEERAELDTKRTAFANAQQPGAQGSTPAAGVGTLRSSGTTSAPSTPAGTAGSSTSAPK